MILRTFCALILAAVVTGCATIAPSDQPASSDPALRECAQWLQTLDEQIDHAGVRDAEAHRLPGFPYLRPSRFLASFAGDVAGDPAKLHDWLTAMRAEDQRGREVEIGNLQKPADEKTALLAHQSQCAASLLANDRANVERIAHIRDAARVPDDYSTARRVAGVYALTSMPFFAGVVKWQETAIAAFAREREVAFDPARHRRYFPAAEAEAAIVWPTDATRDANGIPQYSTAARARLLAAYAPVIEIETTGDDDRFGRIEWQSRNTPGVDVQQPVIYGRLTFTRMQAKVLTQLVYTTWFPRRPATSAFDLVAGELDGVIVRFTLDSDGAILAMDSIHACGCYHEFFPSDRLTPRAPPANNEEWAFVPARLPVLQSGTRINIRLSSGSHYITRVALSSTGDGVRYQTVDEQELRALPTADGTRSLYPTDGLIAGSERAERWLFWPMGIASAGSMRQWGHHATAFVGRRHFDDARLFDLRFSRTGNE